MFAHVPSSEDMQSLLAKRIDEQRQAVGIVAGVIAPAGRRLVSHGHLAQDDARTLDGDTIFEIGSISKVFTALLLADMVEHKEVALLDSVAQYLPAEIVKMPQRSGKLITLLDLATHTSGLPRIPSNLNPKDSMNPYADYTVEQMYEFLSGYNLPYDPGEKYEYSNLGAGLLGHALGLRAGMDYEALIRTRIAEPLNMKSTVIALSPAMQHRFSTGHNTQLTPVANWDLPTLAGAGALRSTANDLLTFLEAFLGYRESPLAPAMKAMLDIQRDMAPDNKAALGWVVSEFGGLQVVWHNGGTGGFRSFMGYDPKARVGVVVLANAMTQAGVDDIGIHLLNPSVPVAHPEPTREHTAVNIDANALTKYAGTYQLSPTFNIVVTTRGAQIYAQATGQSQFEMFAESEHQFFLKVVDAQVTFEVDAEGKITRLVLHQAGREMPGTRLP